MIYGIPYKTRISNTKYQVQISSSNVFGTIPQVQKENINFIWSPNVLNKALHKISKVQRLQLRIITYFNNLITSLIKNKKCAVHLYYYSSIRMRSIVCCEDLRMRKSSVNGCVWYSLCLKFWGLLIALTYISEILSSKLRADIHMHTHATSETRAAVLYVPITGLELTFDNQTNSA